MKPDYIHSQQQLVQLSEALRTEPLIAFDTEFVAEDSYRPQLCLIQVATRSHLSVIDPLSCGDLSPFWNQLLDPEKTVVVHAGREEILFCYRATEQTIPQLFDIQVAAAMLGHEYPASYGNLVQRFVGRQIGKEETRSDWRQRPLTQRQLDYAAQDVRDLPAIYDHLVEGLKKRNRVEWLQEDTAKRQEELADTERVDQWHRLPGVQGLSGTHLAIAKRLWNWRENQAMSRDIPARRVLRDDLLIELARRGSADVKRIANLRGMNYRHVKSYLEELADCIEQAANDPVPVWPKKVRYGYRHPSGMLTQFLGAALAFICRTQEIAPSIVGTSDDLRDFVLYRLESNGKNLPPPAILQGWRRTIIGDRLDDLLHGRLGLALDNPLDEMPLRFCVSDRVEQGSESPAT